MPSKPTTGYVKKYIHPDTKEHIGYISSNKWGNKKYWRNTPGGLEKAKQHSGISNITEAEKMKGPDPCWKGYHMVGKKSKNGKQVPNCVPEELGVMTTSSAIPANRVGDGQQVAGLVGEPPGPRKLLKTLKRKPLESFKNFRGKQ